MRPLTAEWIAKAEEDFAVASREFARLDTPAYNTVCFHSQQAAEKFLKAAMQEADTEIPRTHDLAFLARNHPLASDLDRLRPGLASLSQLAVSARYPGYFANQRAAAEALETARAVRDICLMNLGVEPNLFNSEFAKQMDVAERVMREDRDVLRKLGE